MSAPYPPARDPSSRPASRRQFAAAAGVLGASLALAVLLFATRPVLAPQEGERPLLAVRTVTVALSDVALAVHAQGTVEPRTETELVPEVAGRVVSLSPAMHPGGHFTAGEELLRLDERDYRIAVGAAEAALARAAAEAEFARFESARLATLRGRELTSRSQYEDALRAERVAEAARQEAAVALEKARLDLERTVIRAPFTGRVRNERIDVGQALVPGSPVATIYASDWVEVRLPVADAQLAFLDAAVQQPGGTPPEAAPVVRISADYGGRLHAWDGRIVRTEGEIDARSRMVHVVARVENPTDPAATPLPVGLFVDAEIRGRVARAVAALPREALREGNRVLVVDAGNRLRWRAVEVLRAERDRVLVAAGLSAGERVCISPLQVVVEGMEVAPIEASTGAPGAGGGSR